MTNTYYTLADGTIVKTYAEALKSGQKYTMCYEPVSEIENIKISEKMEARRVKACL